jgi:glucokinase
MRAAGVELGHDRITTVGVDQDGQVIARAKTEVLTGDFAALVGQSVADAVSGGTQALGITIPFHADAVPENVLSAVRDAAGIAPVAVHAGHALVLAEAWSGAARGSRNVISFSIGEHVIAGIVVNGALLTGANGHAGSVAWLALNPVEREDYRRRGGLEAEVAAAGIVRRLVWRIKSGDQSGVIDRVNGDMTRLTADDVLTAAREGDGVCVSVIRDTAKYVGMAIANLSTVVDPEFVVLGGTLASAGDLMLDAIRTECTRRLRPAQSDALRIVVSTLGDEAAAIGAARAAMLQHQ